MRLSTRFLALPLLALGLSPAWHAMAHDDADTPSPQAVSDAAMGREVRSLLARYCYKCHGPDEKTRKAKLRLDQPVKADDERIAPGHPDKSELVARVFSTDA